MRKLLTATLMLVGMGLMFVGDSKDLTATAQSGGVYWINDSGKFAGGKGIYQLTPGGDLELLIPFSKLLNPILGTTDGVRDIALDAQRQIFLLHFDGAQILKATPEGQLSVAVWLPTLDGPVAMAIDPQGNFIIADSTVGVFRVRPDGLTTMVYRVPQLCPNVGSFVNDVVIDTNGDYIVAVGNLVPEGGLSDCNISQLLRITPSGEATVIADSRMDPLLRLRHVWTRIQIDPTGQGYFVLDGVTLAHVSPTGAVSTLDTREIKAEMYGLAIGPTGELVLAAVCYFEPRPDCTPGIYQIAPDGSRIKALYKGTTLVLPRTIQWIAK